MKKIIIIYYSLISCSCFAQQHSDLYYITDSLIKTKLNFISKIENQPRVSNLLIDRSSILRPGINKHQDTVIKLTRPIIILNGKPCYIDELDCIKNSEIDSIKVYQGNEANLIYGTKAINGAILLFSSKDFTNRLTDFNNKDVVFAIDTYKIYIDKEVENKYFWKQLIVNDKYFCETILVNNGKREKRIGISSCILKNYNEFENCFEFEMRISSNYFYTVEELKKENFRQIQGLPPLPPRYKIRVDKSRSYFYEVKKYEGVEI